MRLLRLLPLLVPGLAMAQPFAIGERTITFYDAGRDRDVPAVVRYPAVTAGANAAVADGAFPVLVVGHGFVMTTAAYGNITDHFVPLGYIVALPTTEGGFSPNHGTFGADLAFLAQAFQDAGATSGDAFEGHVLPATALMGHSMGGGAAMLAAANNTVQAVVLLAPAETNPSAVAAAAQVQVPTLVFAASEDCVTPIAAHQGPMYAALGSPCKAFVNIQGGGHCYFANDNFNCSFGEFTCGPDLTISREEQHAVVNTFATPWLGHHLLGEGGALNTFLGLVAQPVGVEAEAECITTGLSPTPARAWSGCTTLASDQLNVWSERPVREALILDAAGRVRSRLGAWEGERTIAVGALAPGHYLVTVEAADGSRLVHRFVRSMQAVAHDR
jgi:predicted dienelactone hydrolase